MVANTWYVSPLQIVLGCASVTARLVADRNTHTGRVARQFDRADGEALERRVDSTSKVASSFSPSEDVPLSLLRRNDRDVVGVRLPVGPPERWPSWGQAPPIAQPGIVSRLIGRAARRQADG